MKRQPDPEKANILDKFPMLPENLVWPTVFGRQPRPKEEKRIEQVKDIVVRKIKNANRILEIEYERSFRDFEKMSIPMRSYTVQELLRVVSYNLCNESTRLFPIEWQLTGIFCSQHPLAEIDSAHRRIVVVIAYLNQRAVIGHKQKENLDVNSVIRRYISRVVREDTPLSLFHNAHRFYREFLSGVVRKACRFGIKWDIRLESAPVRKLSELVCPEELYSDEEEDEYEFEQQEASCSCKSEPEFQMYAKKMRQELQRSNEKKRLSVLNMNCIPQAKKPRLQYSPECSPSYDVMPNQVVEEMDTSEATDDVNGKSGNSWIPNLDGLFSPCVRSPVVAPIPLELLVDVGNSSAMDIDDSSDDEEHDNFSDVTIQSTSTQLTPVTHLFDERLGNSHEYEQAIVQLSPDGSARSTSSIHTEENEIELANHGNHVNHVNQVRLSESPQALGFQREPTVEETVRPASEHNSPEHLPVDSGNNCEVIDLVSPEPCATESHIIHVQSVAALEPRSNIGKAESPPKQQQKNRSLPDYPIRISNSQRSVLEKYYNYRRPVSVAPSHNDTQKPESEEARARKRKHALESVAAEECPKISFKIVNKRASKMLKSEKPEVEPTQLEELHSKQASENVDVEVVPNKNLSDELNGMCRGNAGKTRWWHFLDNETAIRNALFGTLLEKWTGKLICAEMDAIVREVMANQKFIRDDSSEKSVQMLFGHQVGKRLAIGDVNKFVQKQMRAFFAVVGKSKYTNLIPEIWQQIDTERLSDFVSSPEELWPVRDSGALLWTKLKILPLGDVEYLQKRVHVLTKKLRADLIRTFFIVKSDCDGQVHIYYDGTFDKPSSIAKRQERAF